MQTTQPQVKFWLYFNKTDRSFSHSCNVRQPAEYVTEYIEIGAEEDLGIKFKYTLDQNNNIVKGAAIPPSPMPEM